MYNSIKNVFLVKQEETESITDFTRRFKNAVDVMEQIHGPLYMMRYMETRSDYLAIPETDLTARGKVIKVQYQRFMAYIYLRALDSRGQENW